MCATEIITLRLFSEEKSREQEPIFSRHKPLLVELLMITVLLVWCSK